MLAEKLSDYELLVSEVSKELPVIEADLYSKTGCYGLYRNGRIYVEKRLSNIEKRNVLAEEYGHYKTSAGIILNQDVIENCKQEKKARNFGLEKLVSLDDLIKCSEAGLTTHFECADFLGIDTKTLCDVLYYYCCKYGPTHFYKGCILEFKDQSVMILNTGLV